MCRDPLVKQTDFRQKYAYQIEHAYGKIGHGRVACAHGCRKLISIRAPVGLQAHGCPFRNLPPGELARLLLYWSAPRETVDAIVSRAFSDSPALACAEFFAATHSGASSDLLGPAHHPMEFLRRSRLALPPLPLQQLQSRKSQGIPEMPQNPPFRESLPMLLLQ